MTVYLHPTIVPPRYIEWARVRPSNNVSPTRQGA